MSATGLAVQLGFSVSLLHCAQEQHKLMRGRWEVRDLDSLLLWGMGDRATLHLPDAISAKWPVSFTTIE